MFLKKSFERFSFRSCFPGLFVMFGLVIVYIGYGANVALSKLGIAPYYEFQLIDAFLVGLLLGFINFVVVTFFVNQAVQKRNMICNITKRLTKFFSEEKELKECDVFAHFTASICAIFYFATCGVALLFTPGAINANFIIAIFGLGSVMSLFTWFQVFFHHYQVAQSYSIHRLKLDHATWLELTRQFIFIGAATATGMVIYGYVNWILAIPQSVSQTQPFQFALFMLATTCMYIYVGFYFGVIAPILIFLGKISERTEELAHRYS